MIEPLELVYISEMATKRNAYHRPDTEHAAFQFTTHCSKLQLSDCESKPEIEAALTREPCLRCFPVRGRRQRILNLIVVAGIPDA